MALRVLRINWAAASGAPFGMSALLGLAHQPDRRRGRRDPVTIEATIVSDELWCEIACVIRNSSEKGAKLQVPPMIKLPARFDLTIPEQSIAIPVRCIWRRGSFVGVEFVGAPKPAKSS